MCCCWSKSLLVRRKRTYIVSEKVNHIFVCSFFSSSTAWLIISTWLHVSDIYSTFFLFKTSLRKFEEHAFFYIPPIEIYTKCLFSFSNKKKLRFNFNHHRVSVALPHYGKFIGRLSDFINFHRIKCKTVISLQYHTTDNNLVC